ARRSRLLRCAVASASSRASVRCACAAAGSAVNAANATRMRECLLINEAGNMALVPPSRRRLDAGPQDFDEAAQVGRDRQRHLLLCAQQDLEKHVALDAAEEHPCHDFRLVLAHLAALDLTLDERRQRLERA